MKTPTRRDAHPFSVLALDVTHTTDSQGFIRAGRSCNPFYRAVDVDDDSIRRAALSFCASASPASPLLRNKRASYGVFGFYDSAIAAKRSRRSTPIMGSGFYNGSDVSMASGESAWRQRSALLAKLGEHQHLADALLLDVSRVLRDADKCDILLRDLRI